MHIKNLSIDKNKRENYANEIFTIIEGLEIFKTSSSVALFASLGDELSTDNVIQKWSQSKRVLLPRIGDNYSMEFYEYNPSTLSSGAYGIFEPQSGEPLPSSDIDLVIVPGVAFTHDGKRLGRGKGYYDRYLSSCGMRAKTIGVCYPHQIVDYLPTEEHDVVMDLVVTSTL